MVRHALHVERRWETGGGLRNLIATWPPCLSEQWANHTGSRGNYQDLRRTTNGFTAPVPYSDRRGRGALGTTCKPNTSPHSICCLINLINGSFNAPQRRPSQYCRETKSDNGSLVRCKQFRGWLPFSIKVWNSDVRDLESQPRFGENMFYEIKHWTYCVFANIPITSYFHQLEQCSSRHLEQLLSLFFFNTSPTVIKEEIWQVCICKLFNSN